MTYTRKNILLKTAIEVYENDFVCGYSGNDFEEKNKVFMHFIITLTKKVNDFRYCSNKNCICSPVSKIKSLFIIIAPIVKTFFDSIMTINYKIIFS